MKKSKPHIIPATTLNSFSLVLNMNLKRSAEMHLRLLQSLFKSAPDAIAEITDTIQYADNELRKLLN